MHPHSDSSHALGMAVLTAGAVALALVAIIVLL